MIGDPADLARRLRRNLPRRWFGSRATDRPTPILDALLAGLANALSDAYAFYVYAKAQARIATASGGWLDLAAYDFYGTTFPRFVGEGDDAYRLRLRQEVLRDRNTRNAISQQVFDITGNRPHIWEGFHSPTTGGWGTPALAFGRAGRWGSLRTPVLVVITMPRPQGYGIPNRGGWNDFVGGWGAGNFSFVTDADITGTGATTLDILNSINRVRTAGVTYLVRFTDPSDADDA